VVCGTCLHREGEWISEAPGVLFCTTAERVQTFGPRSTLLNEHCDADAFMEIMVGIRWGCSGPRQLAKRGIGSMGACASMASRFCRARTTAQYHRGMVRR